MEKLYTYLYKVLIVGDINVGKTSILDQFTNGHFDDSYISTIGIDFNVKTVHLDDSVKIKLQIWDSCGQERFRALTRTYYRNAKAIVIVYDITNRQSFENAKVWIKEIEQNVEPDVMIVLVGNKTDLYLKRQIQYFEGHELANSRYMEFFETSAKYDNNIQTVFTFIAHKLFAESEARVKKSISLQAQRKGRCCY